MSDKIHITFPDKSVKDFDSGITGMQIAEGISRGLAKNALAISINGEVWDLSRPVTSDAEIKIFTWDNDEGKKTYWHSSAHLMAEAIEAIFPGTKFGIGPPIENGFYYDIDMGDHSLTLDDLHTLEVKMGEFSKRDVPYERKEVSWEEAVAYFKKKGDPYKLELLEEFKGQQISMYHQGNFTDLCYGPHIPSTGKIKNVKLLSIAGAYWRGSEKNKMLQRIYGITFPTKQELDDYLFKLEEAKRRDHRKLGVELELFMISPKIGGGLPVWLPNGTIVRRKLEEFLRAELLKRGYTEVITPHLGNLNLYRTSGHYPYYAESQFSPIKVEDEEYLLKPMNCPHHHQIYSSKPRSYRDLPIRLAEFGTVYRYEQSGELSGLSRVRGFTQDDAHIYCTHEQLKDELINAIELTQFVFKTFDMPVKTRLSFRDPKHPEKYAGAPEMWDIAEREIQEVADAIGLDYFVGVGEAAFYGPKYDFIVRDALNRQWQLGTVQVDYVMPERFELEYVGTDGQKHRPVIIHRAPFGSMERFLSILIEHYAGEFPLWLAPVQAMIMPITDAHVEYARSVAQQLKNSGLRIELDERNEKIGYKIREHELKKIPYMLVVGEKEKQNNSVSVRKHKKGDCGIMTLNQITEQLLTENSVHSTTT
jgi:threonyl-tRNA synthetase